MGSEAAGDAKMREAVHLMEMALVAYQPGSEKYKATLDSLQKLTKLFPAANESPGVQNTQLIELMQRNKQNQMVQAAMRQQAAAGQQQAGGQAPPMGQ